MRRVDSDRFAATLRNEKFALAWADHCVKRFDTGSLILSAEFDAFVRGWHDGNSSHGPNA